MIEPAELVERIWERDPTVWTGRDEAQWLGWLDEPLRMRERLGELAEVAEAAAGAEDVVLLGMGGSSLAPEVLRRAFERDRFHVLDTTHPKAIRRLADALDLDRTLFVVSSKSGSTLETRSHFDFFWEKGGRHGDRFVTITDPGSPLEQLAKTRGVRVVAGEPTIGGRYSALSPFGLVPAALMGVDLVRLLDRAEETLNACRVVEDNPGLALGLALGDAWREGRDKVVPEPNPFGFGLWVEQLLAESTGKNGRGLVPAPGESPDGPDRQARAVELADPHDLGAEFFRWEFATAVAGAMLEINPFDQPNVQEAKDRTSQILSGRDQGAVPDGSAEELFAQVRSGDYVAVQAFVDPAEEERLRPLVARAREATGCVVTLGLGPRYLHSTGQLHKGGAPIGCFLQVVDDTGAELPIPGQKFGFGRLIRAQAEGDYAALKERGRPVARIPLEDIQ
ncbi:MAG: glucose-6-phosphate isomerase [Verrucomicrobiota bacterium]